MVYSINAEIVRSVWLEIFSACVMQGTHSLCKPSVDHKLTLENSLVERRESPLLTTLSSSASMNTVIYIRVALFRDNGAFQFLVSNPRGDRACTCGSLFFLSIEMTPVVVKVETNLRCKNSNWLKNLRRVSYLR